MLLGVQIFITIRNSGFSTITNNVYRKPVAPLVVPSRLKLGVILKKRIRHKLVLKLCCCVINFIFTTRKQANFRRWDGLDKIASTVKVWDINKGIISFYNMFYGLLFT